ncbi:MULTISPECIES: hypothetical protein [Pseudomonas]|uniref:hypothetical protein n=1 Tax=Pseudomonas TaxID=286 RepID=UPI0003DCB57F|nr:MULTISPECIES: hypothetical protein [Pseudomonas]ETK22709.1 hypothetical protein H096_14068 [Pseudomonas sp. FH1]MDB1111916.1 hypothetical protein [Pseudomonas extremaustralis]
MRSCTAALVALIGVTNVSAAADYRCTIERVVAASEEKSNQVYIGKQFSVDRQTGLMVGAIKNSYVTDPQVIDHGSLETSFKVVTTMRIDQGSGASSNIYALTINEYQAGPRKPFIFLDNDEAFLGWCEHY